MAITFSTIPTSYANISREIIRAVDLFRMGQISEKALTDILTAWTANTPQFLLSREDPALLAPQVVRTIGQRRATVVMTILRRYGPSTYTKWQNTPRSASSSAHPTP